MCKIVENLCSVSLYYPLVAFEGVVGRSFGFGLILLGMLGFLAALASFKTHYNLTH